jgi:hypothetical protein
MTERVGAGRLGDPALDLGGPDAVPAHTGQPRSPVLRRAALVWLGAFGILLANDPGRMFFDTKLSVDLDPSGFFASLWSLMDPQNTFGALNNQGIGYAVPMAPFYLAGHLAHVPVWLIERLWLSLIIAVGFAGLVKLAGTLGIGSPGSRLLAGLVFALWPTFTIVIGSTSSAVLPGMLAPWAVLPLVPAVRGRGGVAGAAARSGAVVLGMGGVNATVTVDALLLPGLFILTYARGRRLAALGACWGGPCRCCCRGSTRSTSCPTWSSRPPPRALCRLRPRCAAPATGPPTSTSARPGCPRGGPWSAPRWRSSPAPSRPRAACTGLRCGPCPAAPGSGCPPASPRLPRWLVTAGRSAARFTKPSMTC